MVRLFYGIRPTFQIVKLRSQDGFFCGNAELCFDGCSDKEENLRLARKYWMVEDTGREPICEILLGGEIEVLEILKEK